MLSSVWPLPICLFHGPNIPGSYAILLFTASDLASITSHIHNWVLFLLLLHPFIISEFISPLISSSILGTYQPGEFIFQYPIIFAFSYCSEGSQGKNTEMVCHSLLQWTTFCQTSPLWPIHLEWPHRAWLSFTELDRLWSVWSDWLVFCDYGFTVSALWRPLAIPTVLFGFLLPWMWSIQSAKTRPGADCGSDHELLITKFRLKLKKVGKTTRPFRYDLNQIFLWLYSGSEK